MQLGISLVYADFQIRRKRDNAGLKIKPIPSGPYSWRSWHQERSFTETGLNVVREFKEKLDEDWSIQGKEESPLLKAGMFDGSIDRARMALSVTNGFLLEHPTH